MLDRIALKFGGPAREWVLRRVPASGIGAGAERSTLEGVRAAFTEGRTYYGSPRIHKDLTEQHEAISRKRVIRLMQEEGLKARVRKRYKVTTMSDHDHPIAANVLDRRFTAEAPNQRWVVDTTALVIRESGTKMYLAAILDLFSRFIVGWAVSAVNDRHLSVANRPVSGELVDRYGERAVDRLRHAALGV